MGFFEKSICLQNVFLSLKLKLSHCQCFLLSLFTLVSDRMMKLDCNSALVTCWQPNTWYNKTHFSIISFFSCCSAVLKQIFSPRLPLLWPMLQQLRPIMEVPQQLQQVRRAKRCSRHIWHLSWLCWALQVVPLQVSPLDLFLFPEQLPAVMDYLLLLLWTCSLQVVICFSFICLFCFSKFFKPVSIILFSRNFSTHFFFFLYSFTNLKQIGTL